MLLKNNIAEVNIEKTRAFIPDKNYDYIYDFDNFASFYENAVLDIAINNEETHLQIAIHCHMCGSPEQCALIHNDKLIIANFNEVYVINIRNGQARYKDNDCMGGAFSLHQVEGGYIIHGEMYVVKLDYDLNTVWEFYGEDILVDPEGKDSFIISEDKIELIDFMNNRYVIDMNGKLLEKYDK